MTEKTDHLKAGDRLFFNLFPEDISLALQRVEGISAQNQLNGKLLQLKTDDNHLICLVDVGFRLLVKITTKAAQKLQLAEGMNVVCFFKTSAIKNQFVVPA